jgi:hypothetical protein
VICTRAPASVRQLNTQAIVQRLVLKLLSSKVSALRQHQIPQFFSYFYSLKLNHEIFFPFNIYYNNMYGSGTRLEHFKGEGIKG